MIVLRPQQQEDVDRIVSEPTRAALLGADLGYGKTVVATEVIRRLDPNTTLIVSPKGVVPNWRKHAREMLPGVPFRHINSTVKGKQAYADLLAGVHGVYVVVRNFMVTSGTSSPPVEKKKAPVTYTLAEGTLPEGLSLAGNKISGTATATATVECVITATNEAGTADRLFVIETVEGESKDVELNVGYFPDLPPVMTPGRQAMWSWSKVKPDLTIVDESHNMQNRYSQLYSVLSDLPKGGFRLAMSGTPSGNKFDGVWTTCRWLWGTIKGDSPSGLLVDRSKNRWIADWCETEYDPFTTSGKKVVGEKNPGAWMARMPCYIYRPSNMGAHPPHEIVYVDLTPKQRKMWEKMAEESFVWIDDNPLVADMPLTQKARMRQISLGEVTLTGEDMDVVDFAVDAQSAKLDMLEDLLALNPDDPALIVLDSQKFIKVVLHRLGSKAVEWSGQVTQKNREEILDRFGKDVQYIVATIPSIGEGTDGLQHVAHRIFWLSESTNNLLNRQTEGRLHRTGQTKPVESIKILAADTADDDGYQRRVMQRIALRDSFER